MLFILEVIIWASTVAPGGSEGLSRNAGDQGSILNPRKKSAWERYSGSHSMYSCLETSHGWRSLVADPWGFAASDMTSSLASTKFLIYSNIHKSKCALTMYPPS